MMKSLCNLIILLCLAGLSGCTRTSPDSVAGDDSAPVAKEHGRVAVVVSTLNNPWFVTLADAAKARAEELGHEAVIFDSQNNVEREASTFENVLASGFDAILFNPTDADASVANVRRAQKRGVPVFCIDREINASDAAAAQILSDNYAGCVEIGQYFVETVGESGKYAELLGLIGDNNTHNRSRGFHSVVNRFTGLEMVAQQSADFDRAKGLEVMESIFQSNPDLDAVFCGNDAMALGVYQAIEAAGKAGQIQVFGFDGAEDVVRSIADGKIQATVMQFPERMAQMAAEFADEYLKGRREFDQRTPVAVELVTPENVSLYGDFGDKE